MRTILFAVVGVLGVAGSADAAFSISTQTSSPVYTQGGGGYFDVLLTADAASSGSVLNGFTVAFDIAPAVGVGSPLTIVSIVKDPIYVYPTSSLDPGPNVPPPTGDVGYLGSRGTPAVPGVAINTGTFYGLGRVNFTVDPSATPGAYTISLVPSNTALTLAGPTFIPGSAIAFTPAAFTIAAVPEPGSMLLLSLVGAGGMAVVRMRRKKSVEEADPVTAA